MFSKLIDIPINSEPWFYSSTILRTINVLYFEHLENRRWLNLVQHFTEFKNLETLKQV